MHHSSRLVERQAVLLNVMQAGEGQGWLPGRVTDLSRDGCRLVVSDELAAGSIVQIMFPGFAGRSAQVVWREADQAGCLFQDMLPAAILDYLIRMSDPAARG